MKTAKKVLALLLSVLMVFTMVSSSVVAVAETAPAEKTQIEDVENKVTNAFDTVKGIIDGVHNLVGGILSMLGKECVFCDEVHTKAETDDENTQEPTEPETPPSEPEVPVEPEEPTEPEEPKEDESPENQVGNAFDSLGDLFDSIHNLVGNILAIFGKECPFCDKVHGKDDENIYTVSFELNYDNATEIIPVQNIKKGEVAVEPETPVRDGYSFIGWYTSKTFSDVYDFSTIINQNTVLFAKWFDENDKTDSDNDGIIDSLEIQFGSDPYADDTDKDGVSDYDELNWLNTDPNSKDSDGDDDADEDGLSNAFESSIGTNPAYYDSDYDGLSDSDEVNIYFTDPLNEDSDNDGVFDGIEVSLGTNPLNKEEEFIATATAGSINESVPVTTEVEVITDAEGAGTLEITEYTDSPNSLVSKFMPGYLGAAFDFSVNGEIKEATITFEYDTSLGEIGDDFQPRVYYINEETGAFEELPDQKVENGRVSVKVNHFSKYILLNKIDFDKVWNEEIKGPIVDQEGKLSIIDVAFVVDNSGSMSSYSRLSTAKAALTTFVNALGENDRAALIKFTSYATVLSELTKNKSVIKNKISSLSANGTTSMYTGLTSAINLLTKQNEKYGYKMIIILTDGYDEPSTNYNGYYENLVNTAKDNNIVIYTVGTGTIDENILTKIARETGGEYYLATATSGILDSFNDIKENTIDLTIDENGDKIPDYYEKLMNSGEITLSNGLASFVDIYDLYGVDCVDWDEDGLLNGEELSFYESNGRVYVKLISNPFLKDSDFDDIDDAHEILEFKTDPLRVTKREGDSLYGIMYSDYVYVEQSESNYHSGVANVFDWRKTDESKELIINYFYDYASEATINANSEAIAKYEMYNKAVEGLDTLVNLVKIGKDIMDAGTDAACETKKVENAVYQYNHKRKVVIKNINDKKPDKAIKEFSEGIDDLGDITDTYNSVVSAINAKGFVDTAKQITSTIVGVEKIARSVSKTWSLPLLGEKVTKFANKYQRWMDKKPGGLVSNATSLGVVFEGVDLVNDCAQLTALYGKLQANSEAFTNYIEVLEHMSSNGNDKKYIKNASGMVVKIVLDESNKAYYQELSKAISSRGIESFFKIALSITSDVCPYVKVAKIILDVALLLIDVTGVTESAKSYVRFAVIDAISDGCISLLQNLVTIQGDFYSYDLHNEEAVGLYITQLIQSRIVGTDYVREFLKSMSLAHIVSRLLEGMSRDEIDEMFMSTFGLTYTYSEELLQTISKKLPYYPSNYDEKVVYYRDLQKALNELPINA